MQVIGVSANVLGDMATRPNWGLNELDFVFATLVVSLLGEYKYTCSYRYRCLCMGIVMYVHGCLHRYAHRCRMHRYVHVYTHRRTRMTLEAPFHT